MNRFPSTVYSTDPSMTIGGVPQPATKASSYPYTTSTASCLPTMTGSSSPTGADGNSTPIVYAADFPVSALMGGAPSFYFEVTVEELLPAPHRHIRLTPSTTYHEDDDDDVDSSHDDGPLCPPPVSDKPLPFVVGLAVDRSKLMTTLATPGLVGDSIGYFNHQRMVYRGGSSLTATSAGDTGSSDIPQDDADEAEIYGNPTSCNHIDINGSVDVNRPFVEKGATKYGPKDRMRLGRVASVGCLFDFTQSTLQYTINGELMPVAALLGYNRKRTTASDITTSTPSPKVPCLIPPRHHRHYPLCSPSSSPSTFSPLYPVVFIPSNCGSQYLIHFTFVAPTTTATAGAADGGPVIPRCRFPFTEWVRQQDEASARRQVACHLAEAQEDEDGGEEGGGGSHTKMMAMIVAHLTLRGMNDVVKALEQESTEMMGGGDGNVGGSTTPSLDPPKGGGEGCSSTSALSSPPGGVSVSPPLSGGGATPIHGSSGGGGPPTPSSPPTSLMFRSASVASDLQDVYYQIEHGSAIDALVLLRNINLSPLLINTSPAATTVPPCHGDAFLAKRLDICYLLVLIQVITKVVAVVPDSSSSGGGYRWATMLVESFNDEEQGKQRGGGGEGGASSGVWYVDKAVPCTYPPPRHTIRLATVTQLLQLALIRSKQRSTNAVDDDEASIMLLLAGARRRVLQFVIGSLESFVHDVRLQLSVGGGHEDEHEDLPAHPNAPTHSSKSTRVRLGGHKAEGEEEEMDKCTTPDVAVPIMPPLAPFSVWSLVEDLRCNVTLNGMSGLAGNVNPLQANCQATHVYARSIAERLSGAGDINGRSHHPEVADNDLPLSEQDVVPRRPLSQQSSVSSEWFSSTSPSSDEEDVTRDAPYPSTTQQQETSRDQQNVCRSLAGNFTPLDALKQILKDHLPIHNLR